MNPVKALTSGEFTKDDIGKTVYINNTLIYCQEWRVADVNHDSTNGTVDLWPKYVLDPISRTGSTTYSTIFMSENNKNYLDSYVRSNLNKIYNGFDDTIKNAMLVQTFTSDGVTVNDKMECPSVDEVGCNFLTENGRYSFEPEGSIYPLFGSRQIDRNANAILQKVFYSGMANVHYWTRNGGYYYISNDKWYTFVTDEGSSGSCYGPNYTYYVSAFIRFGKK